MIGAGFAPGSEFLWPFHYSVLLGPDPADLPRGVRPDVRRRRSTAGVPFCAERDARLRRRLRLRLAPAGGARTPCGRSQLTGRIGKPLITVHGTLDTLLPIAHRLRRLRPAHRPRRARASGTATTGSPTAPTSTASTTAFPDRLRPLLPCARTAFGDLTALGRAGRRAAGGRLLPAPAGGPAQHLRPLSRQLSRPMREPSPSPRTFRVRW